MHNQFEFDGLARFYRYLFGLIADAEHEIFSGRNVEGEDTGSVGCLLGNNALIRRVLDHHLMVRQARVRFSVLLDERPRNRLNNDLSLGL